MSPCSIPLPANPAGASASSASLPGTSATSAKDDGSDSNSPFDSVLSQVDQSDSPSNSSTTSASPSKTSKDEAKSSDPDDDDDGSVSAGDRRAMLLAMMMPGALAAPVPNAPDAPTSAAATNAPAPTFALTGTNGKTVTQALADGASVLNFQVTGKGAKGNFSAKLKGTADATAPARAATTTTTAATDAAEAATATTTNTTDGSEQTVAPKTPQIYTPKNLPANAAGAPQKTLPDAGVKFAEKNALAAQSGETSSTAVDKNQGLPATGKSLKELDASIGTGAANGVKSMVQDLSSFTLSGDATSATRSAFSTTDHVAPIASAHAADLVHQISDIADGMWAVDKNSVEVKFNFSDQQQLSVRVQYQNGEVQATFRTDSPELRDAISREWQTQNLASDSRPYRLADPVFATSSANSGASTGDFSSQQQSQQQRSADPSQFFERTLPFSTSRSVASTSSNSAPTAPAPRSEMAGHLHALA